MTTRENSHCPTTTCMYVISETFHQLISETSPNTERRRSNCSTTGQAYYTDQSTCGSSTTSSVLQRSLLYAGRWPPPAAADENRPRANAAYPDDDDLEGELGALGDGRDRPRWAARGRLKLSPVVSAESASPAAARSSSVCRSLELNRRRRKLTPDEKFSRQLDSAISRPPLDRKYLQSNTQPGNNVQVMQCVTGAVLREAWGPLPPPIQKSDPLRPPNEVHNADILTEVYGIASLGLQVQVCQ